MSKTSDFTDTSNPGFWDSLYNSGNTGWDIGYASPAIIDALAAYPRNSRILIPGCGNAYEAEALLNSGFSNITLLDISPTLVKSVKQKFQNHPSLKIICGDFFEHQGRYDLIIEQTFFCAIPPSRRAEYVSKSASLLLPEGEITGLLFNRTFPPPGPPFGGSSGEYQNLFSPYFSILKMELCQNSIPPRAGSELFINFRKKQPANELLCR